MNYSIVAVDDKGFARVVATIRGCELRMVNTDYLSEPNADDSVTAQQYGQIPIVSMDAEHLGWGELTRLVITAEVK